MYHDMYHMPILIHSGHTLKSRKHIRIAITSTKTGDAGVSFNFSIADGTIPTESWDES